MAKKKKSDEDDDDDEKGGGKKKILMIVGGLAAAGAAYQFVLKPSPPAVVAEEPAPPTIEEIELDDIDRGLVVALPELVLNLADEETRYLRATLAVVLESGVSEESFAPERAIASDVAVEYLSSLSYEELRRPGAQAEVKEQLGKRMRLAYDDEKIAGVLFTSFVMQ